MESLSLLKSKVVSVVSLFVLLAIAALSPVFAGTSSEDLRSYYPNSHQVQNGQYLEGYNYSSGVAERSVLWFELLANGKFKQYNYGPEDVNSRCRWDLLQWNSSTLKYNKTYDACGATIKETSYSPGIVLMPRYFSNLPGNTWQQSDSSNVSQIENGVTVCTGVNNWQADVLGWEEIAPGKPAIHVRTTQTTNWTSGQSPSGCAAGYTTNWQEDYFLMPDVPTPTGAIAKAMKRSLGGNRDTTVGNWDIWFDRWSTLPPQ